MRLARRLAERDNSAATITIERYLERSRLKTAVLFRAACELGGLAVGVPEPITEAVRHASDEFLRNERVSKPLGVYTWTPGLAAIFRQDR